MSFALRLYGLCGAALRPALDPVLSGARDPERAARAGRVAEEPRGALWLHASSVGELGGVEAFLAALAGRVGPHAARATCQTRTGLVHARTRLHLPADLAPLDAAFAVRRRIELTRPSALLIFETELWPVLMGEAARAGVPFAWVNGRIGGRLFPRYARFRAVLAPGLAAVRAVAAQGEEDAVRFAALGVPPGRIRVTGNLKHDRPEPRRVDRVAMGLAADGAVAVFGSLREGEEAAVVDALVAARAARPDLVAVLAPRHAAEAGETARLLGQAGVVFARRSEGAAGARTLLLDTLGELAGCYTFADVAFVGGSLAPLGGHDVMEAARAGAPVLFGPHTAHCRADALALLGAGGALEVRDGRELGESVARLVAGSAERAAMAAAALGVAGRSRGAALRALEWLASQGALPGVSP